MSHAWIQTMLAIVLSLSAPIYLQGCGGEKPKAEAHNHDHEGHDHDHDYDHADHDHEGHDHEGEGHAHKAPHGGSLVAIGAHFAHVEVVLDPATGKLSAYVLDGEAEGAVRVAMTGLPIKIKVTEGPEKDIAMALNLEPAANTLTGETVGDTSEFSITAEKLKGVTRFDGTILNLEIKGQSVKDTVFKFPEGNE